MHAIRPSAPPPLPRGGHDPRHDALTLLARGTFGFREADLTRLVAIGRDAWLDEQLDPASIDDSACDARLAPYTWLGQDAAA